MEDEDYFKSTKWQIPSIKWHFKDISTMNVLFFKLLNKRFVIFICLIMSLMLIFCRSEKGSKTHLAKLGMRVGIRDIQGPLGPPLPLYQEKPTVEVKTSFQPQSSPTYGFLIFDHHRDGDIKIIYLIDRTEKGKKIIYFDSNHDNILTKEERLEWKTRVEDDKEFQFFTAPINIRVERNGVKYEFTHYFNIEKIGSKRAWQYNNCYRTGKIKLGRKKVSIALINQNWDGLYDDWEQDALVVDIDGDGRLDGNMDSHEYFKLNEPFRLGKLTYRVKTLSPAGDWIQIVESDKPVELKAILDIGSPAPDFAVKDIHGHTFKLKGKVVLLDFWATWCAPCRPMVPKLKEIYKEFKGRDFLLVGISLDQDLEKLEEFIKSNEMIWTQYCDGKRWDNSVAKLYRIIGTGIPYFYLIDKKGIIRFKGRDDIELIERIRVLIEE